MTRGKILFMFVGLCVVAVLLWIASTMKEAGPVGMPMADQAATGAPATAPAGTAAAPMASGDFYITGHVNRSGMYTLRDGETIGDAVHDAGGADSPAGDLVVRLMRKDNQNTSTQSIPLARVLSGQADEKIQRGDVIAIVQQAKPATLQVAPAAGTASGTPAPGAGVP